MHGATIKVRFGVFEKWVMKVIFGSKNESNRKFKEKCIWRTV